MSHTIQQAPIALTGVGSASSTPSTAASSTDSPATAPHQVFRWVRTRTVAATDVVVSHREAVAEMASDALDALGVGEAAVKTVHTATPWFLRALSPYYPSYHLEKSLKYLQEGQLMIKDYGEDMLPAPTVAVNLLDWHQEFVFYYSRIRPAAPTALI